MLRRLGVDGGFADDAEHSPASRFRRIEAVAAAVDAARGGDALLIVLDDAQWCDAASLEALRVLVTCRKTAVTARRIALQMIHNTNVAAPDGLRDELRVMTRMQRVRTLAASRPDLTAYRDVEAAYRMASSLSAGATSSFMTRSPISTP